MPQIADAAPSRVLLVAPDSEISSRLSTAVAAVRGATLDVLETLDAEPVLEEVALRPPQIVVLGPRLSRGSRIRLLMMLRQRTDAFLVSAGPKGRGPDGASTFDAGADDHLEEHDDASRALPRWLRQAGVRRSAAEWARRAQRMATVAQVAGGVAHDFGNLLQVIQGHVESLGDNLTGEPKVAESLEAIDEAAERAVRLVRQLLSIGSEAPFVLRAVDVDEVLTRLGPILEGLMGSQRRVELELGAGGAEVRAEASLLEQSLLNLAINARHAMESGGRLCIRTRRGDVEATPGFEPTATICIEVEDDGCGMPAEVVERAFEPFFSTRPASEGSGLGLSSVADAVRRFGGRVELDSEVGRGTTIRLLLPESRPLSAAESAAVQASGAEEQGARSPVAAATQEGAQPEVPVDDAVAEDGPAPLVLFVDDEPLVVRVVRNILQRAGFRYLTAEGADEAEALFRENARDVDLLVTDVMMPGRNGRELYESLRAMRPDLPVVFVSGYVGDPLLAETIDDEDRQRLVEKPFRPAQLLGVIDSLMEAAGSPLRA